MEQETFIFNVNKFLNDFALQNNKPYIIFGKKYGKRYSRISNFGRISIVAEFNIIDLGKWFIKIEKRDDIDFESLKKSIIKFID